jgi:hypothetical protein
MLADDLEVFSRIQVSLISSHDATCCQAAQISLMTIIDTGAIETSMATIPAVVDWQAVRWPVYWCELGSGPSDFIGDCGVHAALAALILQRYEVEFSRAQTAMSANPLYHAHWRARWLRGEVEPRWIGEQSVYHEVLKVGERFWDPTEARWFEGPGSVLLAGRVVATRVFGQEWSTESRDTSASHND